MRRLLFDIEADGLLDTVTTIHCICVIDIDTEQEWEFGPYQIADAVELLGTADLLYAHFGLRYDFLVLEKVAGFKAPFEKQRDTVVLSRIRFPNLKETDTKFNKSAIANGRTPLGQLTGKHSLEAWGIRLGVPKLYTDIEDWSKWTPQIQERCMGDVRTNLKLLKMLRPDKLPADVVELEHWIDFITDKMAEAGWKFDTKAAGLLHAELVTKRDELEKKLVAEFGGWYAPKNGKQPFVPKKPDKKHGYWGEYVETTTVNLLGEDDEPLIVKGKVFKGYPCTQIKWVEFNPKSRKHMERCLKKLGWEPTEFTDSGQAKLDDEVLEGISALYPQADGLTDYLMLSKRIGQLAEGDQAWLKKVDANGFIHGKINPIGTVTFRAAHYDPNLGQVPASKSPYGKECRSLFTVPAGWVLVGADMESLEGRCQAHYQWPFDNGEYGRLLLEGDPHWANVLALGLIEVGVVRDKHNILHVVYRESGAKTWYYAFIYGMGGEKSGRILLDVLRLAIRKAETPEQLAAAKEGYERFFGNNHSPSPTVLKRVGNKLKNEFLANSPALQRLIQRVKTKAELGDTIRALDGRVLPIRSPHSAFNALLQSAGALLCKRWVVDAYRNLIAAGYKWDYDGDFVIVGWIHDEVQVACRREAASNIGRIITDAAKNAGKPYRFRMQLDSSYVIGANWAETH